MNTVNWIWENKEKNIDIYTDWIEKLIAYHKTRWENANYVDFNVWFIPWLPWLAPSKIASLQERWWMVISPKWFWVFLIKMDSSEQIEKAIEFYKNINQKILSKIWFDEVVPSFIWNDSIKAEFNEIKDEIVFKETESRDKWTYDMQLPKWKEWKRWVTPYMRVQDFYTDKDLLEKNKEQLKQVEFFNNKANLLEFLKEDFPDVVPKKWKIVSNRFEAKNYLVKMLEEKDDEEINFPIFVKSGIWASWSWLWKFDNSHELLIFLTQFDRETKDFESISTIFDENWEIINDLDYSFEKWRWINTRKKDIKFIVQENTIAEFNSPKKVKEKSINFFIDDNWIYTVTECENYAINWAYVWNKQINLNDTEREKLKKVAKKVKERWYRWPIWFDFFSDWETIKIVEANPRNSWATNPQVLTYNIQKLLNDKLWDYVDNNKKFNLKRASNEIKLEKDIYKYDDLLFTPDKWYWIIPQISLDTNTHKQSILMLFETNEQYNEIIQKLKEIEIRK